MVIKGPLGSPIDLGKTFPVLSDSPNASGSSSREFGLDADGILVSVWVPLVTGSVDVTVDTLGDDGSEKRVITFNSITSPTAELVIKTAVNVLSRIRVTVNYTGSCEYQIRARGIGRGGAGADDSAFTVDFGPITVTNPTIQNIILTTASVEQTVALPSGTKRFLLQAVNTAKLQFAYILNDSGTTYITVFPGNSYVEEQIDEGAVLTLYIQSNQNNTPIQLLSWT